VLQEWTKERSTQLGLAVSSMLKGYTTTAATITATLLKSVSKFAVQVFVSLVLSFMFVWDLPAITGGIASLRSSRLAPVHQEVAPVLGVFGRLFGKALEAQVSGLRPQPECDHAVRASLLVLLLVSQRWLSAQQYCITASAMLADLRACADAWQRTLSHSMIQQ
jgi:hypothetical protein